MEKNVSAQFLGSIGGNIRRLRKLKKLSLEELGLEIGLTRMQVHRIEKGYNITAITLLKVSLALNVKPGRLLHFNYKFKKEDLEKLVENSKGNKRQGKK